MIQYLVLLLVPSLALGNPLDTGLHASEETELAPLDRGARKAIANLEWRWTNAVIPYEFLSGHYNYEEKEIVEHAMKIWQDSTCLQFRPKTSSDKNYVAFRDGSGCYSMVGMVGGRQYLDLSRSAKCRSLGLALHEIGHAIGLVHEHQLPDRDQYIRVYLNHVSGGARTEFKKKGREEVNTYGVPYDPTSIMHYGKNAFTANSDWKTMELIDKSKNYMIIPVSEKKNLAFSDIKVVNLMYNCSEHCAADPSCKSPGFLDKDCKCQQPVYVEFCRNKDPKCETWKANDQCRQAKAYMEANCPISCGICTPKNGITPDLMPTEPPKEIDCRDKNSQCRVWAKSDQCNANKLYMDDACPVACGLCVPEGGVPVDEEEHEKEQRCENKYGDAKCERWTKSGQCGQSPEFMHKQCAKACGVCQPKEEGHETETGPKVCHNNFGDKKCEEWAGRNECSLNAEFMEKQCAKACKICTPTEGEETPEGTGTGSSSHSNKNCYDDTTQCEGWGRMGYCRTNKYTREHCKKTCKNC